MFRDVLLNRDVTPTRRRILITLLVLGLALSASSAFATSARGTVNGNVSKFFGFTMPENGGVEFTLTWNQNHDDLFIVMACGDSTDPLEYSSIATENRVVRLDAGVLGGLSCAFGIASFQAAGTFTLAVSVTTRGPGLRALSSREGGFEMVPLTDLEAQSMGVTDLEDKLRSMRDR